MAVKHRKKPLLLQRPERCHPDSNWRIKVLQTFALPLSYQGVYGDPEGARTLDLQRDRLAL